MQQRALRGWTGLLIGLMTGLGAAPVGAVVIDWVTVGDPGNACDTQSQGCFGSVSSVYRISKFETTNAQYAEFLNAKAAADPLGLYNTNMAGSFGGITQSGSSGSFTYGAIAGRGDKPVNFVSFYDTLRFANWLDNGQGSGDTEIGAYTLDGGTATPSNGLTVTRNASATIFLTSEDEWFKAAYHDGVAANYNAYPFADGFNGTACESPPGTTTHSANCDFAVGNFTDVGAYTTSPSDYGTFDQGGNVSEWNEAIISGSFRGRRGGSGFGFPGALAAAARFSVDPTFQRDGIGFRVASVVPEPTTGLLLMTGLIGLGLYPKRRRRAATTQGGH